MFQHVQFCLVTVHWVGQAEPTSYIVAASQVTTFLKATVELHYKPGINPHNKKETARLEKITKKDLVASGPYWWTTPGLQENNDPRGAKIYDWRDEEVIWPL